MPRNNSQSEQFHFEGFYKPESNWFKMPNYWTDVTAQIKTLAELKVVEYVLRHTWGYQEYEIKKHITVEEFVNGRRRQDGSRIDRGTGLSERSVQYGLKDAVEHGFLEEEIDDSDRGRVKKYYSLCMKALDHQGTNENLGLQVGVQSLHPRVQELRGRGAKAALRTEKDTKERHLVEKHLSSNGFDLDANLQQTQDYELSKRSDAKMQNSADSEYKTQRPKGELTSIGETIKRRRIAAEESPTPAKKRGRPRKYPVTEQIQAVIEQLSDELRDTDHVASNTSQAARLWQESGLPEAFFVQLLYEARSRSKRAGNIEKPASGEAGEIGLKNRMPFFFACLRSLIEETGHAVNERASYGSLH